MPQPLPPLKSAEKQAKLAEKLERLQQMDAATIAELRKKSPYYVGLVDRTKRPSPTEGARPTSLTPNPHRLEHMRLSDDVYKLGTSLHHKGASVQRQDRAEASFDLDELKRVRLHTLLRVAHDLLEDRCSHNQDLTREEKVWLAKVGDVGAALGVRKPQLPTPPPVESAPPPAQEDSQRRARFQVEDEAGDLETSPSVVRRLGTLRFAKHQLELNASPRGTASETFVPLVGATEAVVELLQQPRRTNSLLGSRAKESKLESLMQWIRDDAQAESQHMHKTLLEFAIKCAAAPMTQRAVVLTSIADQIKSYTRAERASVWYTLDDCLIKHDDSDALNLLAPRADNYSREKLLLLECHRSMQPEVDDDLFMVPILVKDVFLGAIVVENATLAKDKPYGEFVEMLQLQADFAELYLRSQMTFLELKRAQENASVLLTLANRLVKTNITVETKKEAGTPVTDEEIDKAEHTLVKSVISTARDLTDSDRCSVFLVRGDHLQAYFDETSQPVTVRTDVGIAGHVARTGEIVRLMDAYEDERFNRDIDKQTGYRTRSLLTMPVYYEGEIVAVAQLVNKSDVIEGTPRYFTDRDEELFTTFSNFIGICLFNMRVSVKLAKERRKTDALFGVAKELAKVDITDSGRVADIILESAKRVAFADRGTLFLVDREHDELVSASSAVNIRIPCGTGIAGSVASTGKPDIIEDAYADTRFNQAVDHTTGYRTRSMVTVPVRVGDGDVVAVAQLVNRQGGTYNVDAATGVGVFTDDDLQLLEGLAAFAGMALHNAQLVEFAIKAADEATSMLTPMSPGVNHASFNNALATMVDRVKTWWYRLYDEENLATSVNPGSNQGSAAMAASTSADASPGVSHGIDELGVTTLQFDVTKLMGRSKPSQVAKDAGARIVAAIVEHYARPFDVPRVDILNFVISCRERYRSVPYHNFFHAVDVVQTVFAFLKIGHAEETLTPIERLALIVAALCHDLDHMGLNNSFYLKTDSPLGLLSSTTGTKSVMEVHHCNEAVDILSKPGRDIFASPKISPDERKAALTSLIRCILATDMQRHKEIVDNFKNSCCGSTEDGAKKYNAANPEHRILLMQMLLKAADISNVTKPFNISMIWAERVTEEFYSQGDREKEIGIGEVPAMFDREAGTKLADGQLGFIQFVARPFFTTLQEFDDRLSPWIEQLDANAATWKQRKEGTQ